MPNDDETVMHPCRECGTPGVVPSTERRQAYMRLRHWESASLALWNVQEFWDQYGPPEEYEITPWKMAAMCWAFHRVLSQWMNGCLELHSGEYYEALMAAYHALDALKTVEARLQDSYTRSRQERC
jgi:hypothetical protein